MTSLATNSTKGRTNQALIQGNKIDAIFYRKPGSSFSKEQIYQSVWNGSELDANTVMVFINHLRNKIEDDPKQARYIKTVWGLGYTFLPDGV